MLPGASLKDLPRVFRNQRKQPLYSFSAGVSDWTPASGAISSAQGPFPWLKPEGRMGDFHLKIQTLLGEETEAGERSRFSEPIGPRRELSHPYLTGFLPTSRCTSFPVFQGKTLREVQEPRRRRAGTHSPVLPV